ncbi:hypothetical protein C2857_007111 [Epichloe festucae Fl1]|uniref:Uncharacterized protein n=1 Tax=Epichloe festucae (strain Fl1) TaxID=877507 RepID=A0A7S9KQJ3_EPIFF|nr:hypothetical protein C2857_007111 [Epichloe festucae Fl1]
MASAHENLPEVAHGTSYPEVYHNTSHQHQQQQHQRQEPWSPHQSTVSSSYVKTEDYPQVVPDQNGTHGQNKNSRRTILGCVPIVFFLSVVIAFLAALVIGLAAGTGVTANKYHSLQASYSALVASNAASASGTPNYSKITNGCSDENESTTGTLYKPDFFGKPSFTMYCNKDALNTPFYSLFTADFNGCMSACASWNSYNASNSVCEGISFIPLWSDMVAAVKGKAPGDCYLKPGPQSVQKLQTPNIGTECHAAILNHNSTSKG